MSSFSMDRVAPGEILRSEARDLYLLNILRTTRRNSCQQETHASVLPSNKLNTAGETWKGQVACHSKSSVLFSSLENND